MERALHVLHVLPPCSAARLPSVRIARRSESRQDFRQRFLQVAATLDEFRYRNRTII